MNILWLNMVTSQHYFPPQQRQESGWTEEELSKYIPLDYLPLLRLYQEEGLHTPEERANFLAEIALTLTHNYTSTVVKTVREDGRAAALHTLELIVKRAHQAKIQRETSNIILPLE